MTDETTYDGPRIGDTVEVRHDAAGRSGRVIEMAGQHGVAGAWVQVSADLSIWFPLVDVRVLERARP